MKFKFLSLMMAIAVALAFTSCDNKGTSSASDDSDSTSSKSESVSSSSASDEQSEASESASEEETQEDAAVSNELSGDPAQDAQACADEMVKLLSNAQINSKEDIDKLDKSIEELQNKYMEKYKDNPAFQEELDKLENSETVKKIKELQEELGKKAMEYMK